MTFIQLKPGEPGPRSAPAPPARVMRCHHNPALRRRARKAAALNQRRNAAQEQRVACNAASASTAAPQRSRPQQPAQPGVATTSAGSAPQRHESPAEETTGTNARWLLRRASAPTAPERHRSQPHSVHRHCKMPPGTPGTTAEPCSSEPRHTVHLAGIRHHWRSDGTYPARATCTSTGPRCNALRASINANYPEYAPPPTGHAPAVSPSGMHPR